MPEPKEAKGAITYRRIQPDIDEASYVLKLIKADVEASLPKLTSNRALLMARLQTEERYTKLVADLGAPSTARPERKPRNVANSKPGGDADKTTPTPPIS